jgi:hypothetical protein
MPLAAALGLAGDQFAHDGLELPAVDPRRVVLLGVRSLDTAERALMRDTGIRAITMTEIDRIGIERAVLEAIDRASGPGFVHVSLDLDALDPEVAPGVGTPVKGGLTYREAHLACEDLAESGLVGSLELVEVNPILDRENGSAAIAVELAASALGQSILCWGNPWFPIDPLLCVTHGSVESGLPAGKAGLRPQRCAHGSPYRRAPAIRRAFEPADRATNALQWPRAYRSGAPGPRMWISSG